MLRLKFLAVNLFFGLPEGIFILLVARKPVAGLGPRSPTSLAGYLHSQKLWPSEVKIAPHSGHLTILTVSR